MRGGAALNTELEETRAQLASHSDRQCLDAGTVRLLNATSRVPGGAGLASASDLAGPAAAPAVPAPNDYASERDTAAHIAICRTGYAALGEQLNQTLDIEDRRQAGQP